MFSKLLINPAHKPQMMNVEAGSLIERSFSLMDHLGCLQWRTKEREVIYVCSRWMHQVNNRWWNHTVQDEMWTLGGELAKSLYIYCTCAFYLYPFSDQFHIHAQYYSYAFTLRPLYARGVESLRIKSSNKGAFSKDRSLPTGRQEPLTHTLFTQSHSSLELSTWWPELFYWA